MQKVHITLAPEIGKDSEGARQLVAELIEKHGLTGVNESRVKRFGIISGEIPEDQLQIIGQIPGIRSVTLDEEKRAMKGRP